MRNFLAAVSAIAAAALSVSVAPAQAAAVLDVGRNEGCGKTTCFNDQGRFTQTWTSKDAGGPITISKLLLDRGVLGSLDSSMFRLSFQLNGEELGTWGSFAMGGIAGDELMFQGESFTWNPEDGDLTLVLEIYKPKSGAGGGFSARNESGPNGDPEFPNFSGAITEGLDLGLGTTPSAAPEPAAWALMIGGFGFAGAMLRRRTRVVA